MPAVDIPWPTSALPGNRPGAGAGDLVNVFASQVGEEIRWRRVGGLEPIHQVAERTPRGMHATTTYLLHAWEEKLYVSSQNPTTGVWTTTSVPLAGTGRVTFASNLRTPTPGVAVVTGGVAYALDPSVPSIAPWADGDIGAVDTVEYYAGYFMFTRQSGEIIASGLQADPFGATSIDPLSIAKAEYSADFLRRIVNNGSTMLAFGDRTTEIWTDVGASPFPAQRQNAIDVGVLGMWTVAGGANAWEFGPVFIAADYTVRMMEGYQTRIVSNDAVSRDIYAYRDKPDLLDCFVYGFGMWSVFTITSPEWTWEYIVNTGQWHRRRSHQRQSWRAKFGAQYRQQWFVQETLEGRVCRVNLDYYEEAGQPMPALIESAPIKDFPAAIRVPSIDIDMAVATGSNIAATFEPRVQVSWSHDGGASWSNPLIRSLGKQGEYWRKITVRNLGRSTHHGVRVRLEIQDPVPIELSRAVSTRTQGSRPRQVA